MELDDYKTINTEQTGEIHGEPDSLSRLIEEMKEKDAQDRKALRFLVIFFAMFLVIYAGVMSRYHGLMQVGYALLAGGFLLTLFYIAVKLWFRGRVDYAAPVAVFLRKAERRLAYMRWPELLLSTGLILVMGTGGGMIVFLSLDKYFPGSRIPLAIYVLVLLAATVIGHLAGKSRWNKEKRPLFEKIRALRKEF